MLTTTQFIMQVTILMRFLSTNELTGIQIGNFSVKNSGSEKLLGVNIDSKLNLDCHVSHLCNKANKKIKVTC